MFGTNLEYRYDFNAALIWLIVVLVIGMFCLDRAGAQRDQDQRAAESGVRVIVDAKYQKKRSENIPRPSFFE